MSLNGMQLAFLQILWAAATVFKKRTASERPASSVTWTRSTIIVEVGQFAA